MKLRKITSLTAMLSFILMILTSVILFIVPQGRVAYWSDWRLWGLSKTDWGNIHINMGLLFLIALGIHLYYNWKPILSYLKNKRKQIKILTPEFNVSLTLVAVFVMGTYFLVPPFNGVMALNDHFKDAAAKKHGEPPYGHAELSSLKSFAKKLDLDLQQSMEGLKASGIQVTSADQSLLAIANRNDISPHDVYLKMKPDRAQRDGQSLNLPQVPPPGFGRKTLADIGSEYHLSLPMLRRHLADNGIEAAADQSLKTIAEKNGKVPIDIYETLRGIASEMSP